MWIKRKEGQNTTGSKEGHSTDQRLYMLQRHHVTAGYHITAGYSLKSSLTFQKKFFLKKTCFRFSGNIGQIRVLEFEFVEKCKNINPVTGALMLP